MLFLIDYDRQRGRIVSIREFAVSERHHAERMRLDLEVVLNRSGIEREVVLLDAASEAALRASHRRYFEDLKDLAGQSASYSDAVNEEPSGTD